MNNTTDKEIFETEMNANSSNTSNTSNNKNHINVQQQSMVSNATTQLTDLFYVIPYQICISEIKTGYLEPINT